MRVLHLEAGTHVYGGALQALLLVEGLQARGLENLLVVPRGSAVEGEARSRGIPVRGLPMGGEGDLRILPRLRSLFREVRPDLAHLHSRRGADTLGALAARWAGVPAVLSRRVDNPEPLWAVGPKYRLFDAVITISEAIQAVLLSQGVPPEKLHCVRSALDPESLPEPADSAAFRVELGLPPDAPLVGMAAQFIRRKGHDILLEAVPAILRHHPSARFLLFGRGPLGDQVEGRAREVGLEAALVFPGFREDLPALLPSLDLLVHPARREGLGVVLLQASASGVPIVATRVGGIPEVVAHGETGFLVPPEDPGALAEAVTTILGDADLARSMGKAGRRRIREDFSVEGMVEGNLAVYRRVVGQQR